MKIRSGTAQTVSGVAGTVDFGQPFENGVDVIFAKWQDNNNPTSTPTFLPTINPTASGFDFQAQGPNSGTISYIALGH